MRRAFGRSAANRRSDAAAGSSSFRTVKTRRPSRRLPKRPCLQVIRVIRVELVAERDPGFARELREVAFQSLTRSQAQRLILGRFTALEKVGSFLLSLDGRASDASGQVVLPVSRYDIADYLAVSVETRFVAR